jgi:hypothetical protein
MTLETIEAGSSLWRESSHGSPKGAISSAKSFDRMHYKPEIESCLGRTITSIQWNDVTVFLHFDGEQAVQIHRVNDMVDYDVIGLAAVGAFERSGMADTVAVQLKERRFVWERAQTLKSLQGNLLQRIFVTPSMLFLYASNIGILSFSTMTNLRTGKEFLYWRPSD